MGVEESSGNNGSRAVRLRRRGRCAGQNDEQLVLCLENNLQHFKFMKNMTVVALGTCVLSLMFSSHPGSIVSFAQKTTKDRVCKASVLAASKPLPVLRYPCGSEGTDDSDEKILKQPQRIRALEKLEQRLGTFTSASWWQADVDDRNICQLRGKAGPLNEEEKERLAHGDYLLSLWGNSSFRLVLTPDPCYQTGYGGSNAFLLYRGRGRVVVSRVLDGYFSRP